MGLRASVQIGDQDGVVGGHRKHREFATQESSALQFFGDLVWVLADLGELAEDLGHIDGANRRASYQRVLDHLRASFIVEIGEKSRSVKDGGRVVQSARGGLSPSFRPSFGDQLIGKGSVPCSRPVEPSCFSHR
jgi:hypothetical protein